MDKVFPRPGQRALSIQQPWAWLVAAGYKNIENRTWKTGYTGGLYIHAGKKRDEYALNSVLRGFHPVTDKPLDFTPPIEDELFCGGIIGETFVRDCVTSSASEWFVGPYGIVCVNSRLFEKPVPLRGQLGFFKVDPSAIDGTRP
jgi:hypothetical protein